MGFEDGDSLTIFPISGLPEVHEGDDLAAMIVGAAAGRLATGDILVIAQKAVSKAEGAVVDLRSVEPGDHAQELAKRLQRDPRLIQVVLDETQDIIRDEKVLIVRSKHGFVCVNAGVDRSNIEGEEMVTLLPADSDASADQLRRRIHELIDADVGVIISDSFGRPWRTGLVNVALGVAGTAAITDYVGQKDDFGRQMSVSMIASADELAAAAEVVMGKVNRVPVAVIRGFKLQGPHGLGRDLVRPASDDMFRL